MVAPMTPKELRTRRLDLGLSTEDLAAGLGLTTLELEQMERGQSPLPPEPFLRDALERIEASARNRVRDCLVVEDDEAVRTMFARAARRGTDG